MNRNQWLVFAITFFIVAVAFQFLARTNFSHELDAMKLQVGDYERLIESEGKNTNEISNAIMTNTFINRYSIRFSIYQSFATVSWLISIACFVCVGLESKKNMEDYAPKEHKKIVKLARLEHEVKELKNKLKSEGKIRN